MSYNETTATGTVPPLAAFLRPELHPAALHGLPGDVATTLADATGADPAAVLLAFLTLAGNAAGPQPHAWFGGAQHPGRLFVVLVGEALVSGAVLGFLACRFDALGQVLDVYARLRGGDWLIGGQECLGAGGAVMCSAWMT